MIKSNFRTKQRKEIYGEQVAIRHLLVIMVADDDDGLHQQVSVLLQYLSSPRGRSAWLRLL